MRKKVYYYLKLMLRALYPLTQLFENLLKKKYKRGGKGTRIFFIVGTPRSGSTLLYQIISNSFEVTYVDNLICLFHKTPLLGIYLGKIFYGGRKHNNFESDYGKTFSNSMRGPSECGEILKGLFDKKLNSARKSTSFYNILNISMMTNKTLVFKDLNSSLNISRLNSLFPFAKFIHIKRDVFYNCQSVLLARRKYNVPHNKWWGIKPEGYKKFINSDEFKKSVFQVKQIELQIMNELKDISINRKLEINYEDLCDNTFGEMKRLSDFLNLKTEENFPKINKRNLIRLNNSDEEKLRKQIMDSQNRR